MIFWAIPRFLCSNVMMTTPCKFLASDVSSPCRFNFLVLLPLRILYHYRLQEAKKTHREFNEPAMLCHSHSPKIRLLLLSHSCPLWICSEKNRKHLLTHNIGGTLQVYHCSNCVNLWSIYIFMFCPLLFCSIMLHLHSGGEWRWW